MKFSRLASCIILAAAVVSAHAADKACTPADAAKAEKLVDNVVTWAHMQKAYQDFAHCDTGTVGDLYTESLLRLVVEWKNVDQFAAMMQKDEPFKAFVLKHLKTATKDDQRDIRMRAQQSCPKGCEALCTELVAATSAAPPPAAPAAAPK